MPYIPQARRLEIDVSRIANTPGELNYALTSLIIKAGPSAGWLRTELLFQCEQYLAAWDVSYSTINDVIGACACAAMEVSRRRPQSDGWEVMVLGEVVGEIYDRIAGPYEDKKIAENGDLPYVV